MLVRSRMTSHVHTVTPTTTIADALALARAERIRHLPVVEQQRLVGIVTERDLRSAVPPAWADDREEYKRSVTSKRVREVMTSAVITAAPTTPVEQASQLMYENRIGCLPVVDGHQLVGIITETDLLRSLVELFGANQPSARLEIRMPNRAGELARVVRVIGIEHKVNILGLVVPPAEAPDSNAAIVQLQTADPTPIIEALRKLGYLVGWPSLEPDAAEAPLALDDEGAPIPRSRQTVHH
jgi:acetoin utilization protein AcuB